MTIVLTAISFGLGVYLSTRTIAAVYRIIDLWYALAREWLPTARGVVGWLGATAIAALLMDRAALLWGFACHAILFAGLSLASQLWFSFHLRE